ncbi:hypothetical protein YERSI8AC_200161 [Enterobacterales bacterium 8AC]|nr:hypothetical protein YERSI8AC_200161 [Enterobacterales bacterium 8AC]
MDVHSLLKEVYHERLQARLHFSFNESPFTHQHPTREQRLKRRHQLQRGDCCWRLHS